MIYLVTANDGEYDTWPDVIHAFSKREDAEDLKRRLTENAELEKSIDARYQDQLRNRGSADWRDASEERIAAIDKLKAEQGEAYVMYARYFPIYEIPLD